MELTRELLHEESESEKLVHKLLVMLYLAGGYFNEGKTARATVLNLSSDKRFSDLLNIRYDARFFGLVSSEVEAALSRAFELGYTKESYYARNGEPIHLIRQLSKEGERLVGGILGSSRERDALG